MYVYILHLYLVPEEVKKVVGSKLDLQVVVGARI